MSGQRAAGRSKGQGYPVQIIHAIAALATLATIHPIVERCQTAKAEAAKTLMDKSIIEPGTW
jgi:hypothetical protein